MERPEIEREEMEFLKAGKARDSKQLFKYFVTTGLIEANRQLDVLNLSLTKI